MQTNQTINDLFAQFEAAHAKAKKEYDALTDYQAINNFTFPFWKDFVVVRLAESLKRLLHQDSYEISGPFGVAARLPITFSLNNQETLYITIDPISIAGHQVGIIDYTTNNHRHKRGTIGEVNGFNHPIIAIDPKSTADNVAKIILDNIEKFRLPDAQ